MPALGTHALATDVVFADQLTTGTFPRTSDAGSLTVTAYNGAVIDSGSVLFDGDSFLRTGSNLGLTYPFTIACFYNGAAVDGKPISVSWSDDNYVEIESTGSGSSRARVRSVAVVGDINGGAIHGVGWIPIAIICESATSRKYWIDGTMSSPETTNVTPSGTSVQEITIGALTRDAALSYQIVPNGSRVRHAVIWQGATNGAMDDTKLDQWAADPDLIYSSGGGSAAGAAAHYYRQMQ